MDDLLLRADIDDLTTLSVSPIDQITYRECIDGDALGGSDGYFVIRSSRRKGMAAFEVLAKAPSFEAAAVIFDLIVGPRARAAY